MLALQTPTPQCGQTHSNNSLATADELLSVFDLFVGSALKVLANVQVTVVVFIFTTEIHKSGSFPWQFLGKAFFSKVFQ